MNAIVCGPADPDTGRSLPEISMQFSLSAIPDIKFGPDEINNLATHAKSLGDIRKAAIVMDGFLANSGLGARVAQALNEAGIEVAIYSGFSGEPKLQHVRDAG